MRPITYHVPKPLVRICGKNLVEHNLEKLPKEVTELIFVVGYLKEQVMNHFGDEFNGRKVKYVVQKKYLGTAHALDLCRRYITGRFIVMMSDDVYSGADFRECLKYEQAILVKKVRGKSTAGKVVCDDDGNMVDIIEGTHDDKGGILANLNFFVLLPDYFEYKMVAIKGGKEYGLPQTVVKMSREHPIKIVEATNWMKIDGMSDLKTYERELRKKKK